MKHTAGMTLIELLVAVGIFSILLIMVSGIFTRFMATERRDISERALQEDIRFALELFSREARTSFASTYALAPARAGKGDMIVFRNQNLGCVAYQVQDGVWQRASVETSSPCDTAPYTGFTSLTSSRTVIDSLRFLLPEHITREGVLDRQGFITVAVKAHAANASIPPLFLQTTVTSRQINAVP